MKFFLIITIGILILLPLSCQIDADPPDISIMRYWTATGDDWDIGTATAYDLRWSYDSMQLIGDWDICTQVSTPTPQVAGTPESCLVENLPSDAVIFFAIKAVDDAGNWSQISNILCDTTADVVHPGAITDLR